MENKVFDNSNISLKEIESLEYKYLMKYWYFLKFAEDEMVDGLQSMSSISDSWKGKYGGAGKISEFDVGCERIVYALLNGKIAGKPNSNPVSSDLFFEVDDAYIHIDLKSVTTSGGTAPNDNIGDFNTSIFVGENQNSYTATIIKNNGSDTDDYKPNLPTFYVNQTTGEKKITLTYFVCLLNNAQNYNNELISIMCMPNGRLVEHYNSRPLKAGKNPGKARFNFSKVPTFELLENTPPRVRIIHKNPNMNNWLKDKLSFYLENFDIEIK